MKKILIVDDDENILRTLSRALQSAESEILTASKIEQAEYAIKHSLIDLLIADIRLTGVLGREGLELLSYVTEKSPQTKVIIMTGYGTPEIEKESYERGAFYYIEKPIDLKILLARAASLNITTGLRNADRLTAPDTVHGWRE